MQTLTENFSEPGDRFLFCPCSLSRSFSPSSPSAPAPAREDAREGWEVKTIAPGSGRGFLAPWERPHLRRFGTARREGGARRLEEEAPPLPSSALGSRREWGLTFPEPAIWRPSPAGRGRACQKPSEQPPTPGHQCTEGRHLEDQR